MTDIKLKTGSHMKGKIMPSKMPEVEDELCIVATETRERPTNHRLTNDKGTRCIYCRKTWAEIDEVIRAEVHEADKAKQRKRRKAS